MRRKKCTSLNMVDQLIYRGAVLHFRATVSHEIDEVSRAVFDVFSLKLTHNLRMDSVQSGQFLQTHGAAINCVNNVK